MPGHHPLLVGAVLQHGHDGAVAVGRLLAGRARRGGDLTFVVGFTVGPDQVDANAAPRMGSEDFADMTMAVPGAYVWLGAGPGAGLHNAAYNFADSIIPIGSAFLARMVERRTAL